MPKRSTLPLLTAPLLAWSATSAVALGFGAAPGTAVLGAPLDFRVALRLEPSESIDTACIAATVTSGQNLVPPETVDIALEGQGSQRTLRVKTNLVITEPLVTVTVSAGCSSRITRRFTLFADPPGHRIIPLPQPPSVQALAEAAAARVPVSQPASAGSGDGPSKAAAPVGAAAPGSASAAASTGGNAAAGGASSAQPPAPAPDKAAPPVVVASREGASAAAAASAEAEIRRPPARVLSKIKVRASASAQPALKLEAPQISQTVVAAAALAEREAAAKMAEEAAAAAKAAAAAAESRAAALERSVAALQQQLKAQRESIDQLTLSLRNTQSYGLPWPWMAGVALLALLSLWLYVRLRRARREAEGWWSPADGAPVDADATANASASAESPEGLLAATSSAAEGPAQGQMPGAQGLPTAASLPAVPSAWPSLGEVPPGGANPTGAAPTPAPLPGLPVATAGAAMAAPAPLPALELAADADEVPQSERTQLMPSGTGMSAPLRAVSIEELLDLEQQVEFFTVLGQDDAAIGLLVDHLRHTGGTYPLPYLKLMEFYRRKGDGEAYERIRDRFNGRFNAVAPAWGAAKGSGRSLEDYPEVLQQITPVWKRPVDAMALLENMLFRTQAGAMFDLPALSDVLFLFTLARDLHEHESGGVSDVDVLLPLDGGDAAQASVAAAAPAFLASATAPSMPGELDASFIASKPMDLEAPSQALDFDLTASGVSDEPSVAVVDLEFDTFAAKRGETRDQDRVPHRDGARTPSLDISLDALAGLQGSNTADAVPERPESGYFDLPPLTGASGAGLAPLPAPGGGQRRSDPPMDFDIPLGDALTPSAAASSLGAGRGSQAEPGVDLAFDIDLPLDEGSGSKGRSSSAGEEPPGASRRLGPVDPTDFNLGLLDLAPLDQGPKASGRSTSSDESALDLDLPLTPPAPGRR